MCEYIINDNRVKIFPFIKFLILFWKNLTVLNG